MTLLLSLLPILVILALLIYDFTLPVLYSPGFYLLIVCLFTILTLKLSFSAVKKCIHQTGKQLSPVLISTLGFVAMSQVMAEAGMTQSLSQSAALFIGPAFLYLSPLIGGLGGFLTGSNTGSNAMFIQLQIQTAQQLHLNPDLFAYAQNTGSSHLTMACPSRVVLAASICQIPEQENRLLRIVTGVGLGTLILLMIGVIVGQRLLYT